MGLYCDIIRLKDESIDKCLELKEKQTELYLFIQNTDPDNWFELDKAWHGIHSVLCTGSTEAETKFLLEKGIILRDYNWEEIYGVSVTDMRAFTREETLKIYSAIYGISDTDFKKMYDPKMMNRKDIYPHIWKESSSLTKFFGVRTKKDQFAQDFITTNFTKLKNFIQETSEKQMGIIIKYHQ